MASGCKVCVVANDGTVALKEALKADHGFNADSRTIRNILKIMSSYDATTRRHFLQFITGSPKLPIGGRSYVVLLPAIRGSRCVQISAD